MGGHVAEINHLFYIDPKVGKVCFLITPLLEKSFNRFSLMRLPIYVHMSNTKLSCTLNSLWPQLCWHQTTTIFFLWGNGGGACLEYTGPKMPQYLPYLSASYDNVKFFGGHPAVYECVTEGKIVWSLSVYYPGADASPIRQWTGPLLF